MLSERVSKRMVYGKPGGSRKGKPRLRWRDDVENDLRQMGMRRWRTKAVDRDEWRMLIEEAWVLAGTVAPRSKYVSNGTSGLHGRRSTINTKWIYTIPFPPSFNCQRPCAVSGGGGGYEVPCFTYCQCIDILSTEVISKGDLVCCFDCNPNPLLGSGGA
jgi:hypothetical protein